MVHYAEAFKRPFTNFKRIVLGIILSAIPIVNFIAAGYSLECAKTAVKGDFKLPTFKKWGDLFMHGFFITLIGLIYSIPLFILLNLFTDISLGPFLSPLRADFLVNLLALGASAQILIVLVFLLTIYLIPNAILSYAFHENVRSAFVFSRMKERSLDKNYFKNWFLVMIVYGIIIAIFVNVPLVGVSIATFLASIVGLSILGEVYDAY